MDLAGQEESRGQHLELDTDRRQYALLMAQVQLLERPSPTDQRRRFPHPLPLPILICRPDSLANKTCSATGFYRIVTENTVLRSLTDRRQTGDAFAKRRPSIRPVPACPVS